MPAKRHSIVIVDDSADVGVLLKAVLGPGFDVAFFTDPKEAVRHVESHLDDADLVLTDLKMPDMSGLEVLQAVKRLKRQIPVVVMSGHIRDDKHKSALMSGGAADVLTKPFPDFREFVDRLAAQMPS